MASRRWPTKLVVSWEAVGDVQLRTCKEVWNFWQVVIFGMFWESFELQCVTCWQVHPRSARVASDLVRPFRSIKASTSSSPYRISLRSLRNHISVCVSEIRKTFSPLGAAFSAGAAWSGARKDPRASPQPGAIPTTARANWLKALWDQNFPPRHSQAICSNRFQSLPRCLDYFDGKLACGLVFSHCQGFCFWGSKWRHVWVSQSSAIQILVRTCLTDKETFEFLPNLLQLFGFGNGFACQLLPEV